MTQQPPTSWHDHDDGDQPERDNHQTTRHTAAPSPRQGALSPTVRARPSRHRSRSIATATAMALAGLVALAGCSAGQAAAPAPVTESTPAAAPDQASPDAPESEPAVTFTMPNLVGKSLQAAQDELQALGSYLLDQQDASGEGRMQMDDSNWKVCSQDPAADTEVSIAATVVLASVKNNEDCSGQQAQQPGESEESETANMTTSQEQAVRKAEQYLEFAAFSRSGLIEQLKYEGFSKKDSTFAVDHVEVDWNEQAARKAQAYLDISAFSRKGLIAQLEFDGFTRKQAEYGVKAVGL